MFTPHLMISIGHVIIGVIHPNFPVRFPVNMFVIFLTVAIDDHTIIIGANPSAVSATISSDAMSPLDTASAFIQNLKGSVTALSI